MTQNAPRFGGTPVARRPRFGGEAVAPETPYDPRQGSFQGQSFAPAPPRNPLERFTSTAADAARRNPLIAATRALLPGGYREEIDPATGETVRFRNLGQEMRDQERERRGAYEREASSDPWYRAPGGLQGRAVAGAMTLGGAFAGGASDPTSLIAPGRSIVGRVVGGASVNAGLDAAAQGADVRARVADRYSPSQTALAAAVGGVIGGAEGALARAPLAPERVSNLVRNPVPRFDGQAVDISPPPPRRPVVRAPDAVRPAIERAARESGVDGEFLTLLAQRESAFNPSAQAPTSSARGLYQFTEATWLNTLRRHGERLGLPDIDRRIASDRAGVLALRDDPELSSRAAAALTADNAASLRRVLGREPTTAELYSAHFLGEAGARRLAEADADARAADLFPQAARANRSIFYDGDRAVSVAELRTELGRTFGSSAAGAEGPSYRPPSPEAASTLQRDRLDPEAFRVAGRGAEGPLPSPPPARLAVGPRLTPDADAPARAADLDEPSLGVSRDAPAQPPTPMRDQLEPRERVDLLRPDAEPPKRLALTGAARFPGTPVRAQDRPRFGTPDRLASGGQRGGGMREAPRPGAVPRGEGQAYQGKTVSELAEDLRNTLGITQRQGRVSTRQALGEYDTGSGVVRTRAVQELDVLAHEAMHALEFERAGPNIRRALASHAKELEALAYPGAAPGVKREEGFAEFGRWYLTNPDHARRVAPQFYDAFEQALEADDPAALRGMRDVQAGYQNLLGSASLDVAKQSVAYTGNKGPIRNLIDEVRRRGPGSTIRRIVDDLYTALVDDLHPIAVAERDLSRIYLQNTGQRIDLKRAASPYALARLTREAYAAGHNDLMNGVTPYRGLDPEGDSLADALETANISQKRDGNYDPEALREFDAYLIARRMIHEWDRYGAGELDRPPDRNTRQFHEQVIADAEAANPTWAEAAGKVYGFLENLWRKEYEAGLIKQETYEAGLRDHPDYVPLMRDMSDKGPGRAGKPRGALQFAGGVKAFEGSSRDIISPLSTIMRRAYEVNAIIKRNDVMKALDDLAQAAGRGAGAYVERLPAHEVEAFTVNAEEALRSAADELGLSGRDLTAMQKFADDAASQDTVLTMFRRAEISPKKGEAVVFVWRNGQKTPLLLADGEFGQQMYQALTGLNRDLSNIAVDIMAAGTQTLRYGVTLSPEFMGANLVRDAIATWINTDVGFVPVLDTVRGGASELSQDQWAKRYAAVGGMRGGANVAATSKPFPRTDAEAEAQLQHLRRKGWKIRRFASWRGLAEATDLSETSTRLGVFQKAYNKAKREGLSDYEALIDAGFLSRDYLDFGRRGSKMVTASRLVTFLNAALQGLDKSSRVLSAGGNLKAVLTPLDREPRTAADRKAIDHARKAWAKVAMLGAIGLGLRMLYAEDPEYQEINDRLRATHWIFRSGGQWVFVPKPFELATLSNILERAYEGTVLADPTAGERLLSDFRHTIAPPSEIPALSVPFSLARNRDYLGRPIVPDHLLGTVDPEQQFNSYTSDLGKLIGRTFNLSPAQVDYVVTGFGGSLGRYVLQGSNLIGEAVTGRPRTAAGPEDMFLARRFIRQVSRGSTSQAEFWDRMSRDGGEFPQAEGTFRSLMKEGRDAEAIAYLNELSPEERAFTVAKVFSIDGSSRLHPMVRAQEAVAVLNDFRRAVVDGELRDASGAVVSLTPRQRRQIDNATADLAQAEMRNALIDTGARGWSQKAQLDGQAIARRIFDASPEAAAELERWMGLSGIPSALHPQAQAQARMAWSRASAEMSRQRAFEELAPLLQAERLTGGDRLNRYRESQRVRGLLAPAPSGGGLLERPPRQQGLLQ